MNEVAGERIDLIPYADEAEAALANALAPAKVSSVRIIDADNHVAEILVAEEQLALAIGKEGQNVRLAQKLTGWTMEVKSEGQKQTEFSASKAAAISALSVLEGVGPKSIEVLVNGGIDSLSRLAESTVEDLTALPGIGEKTAAKIISAAKTSLSGKSSDVSQAKT
jgi:N utilization substance protein A